MEMRSPKMKLIYSAMTFQAVYCICMHSGENFTFPSSFCFNTIVILLLNDIFLSFSKGISVRSSLGQSILKVEAVDADSVGSVTYSIQQGNRDNAIGIDSRSGVLYNAVLMNSYGGQTFDLKLRATDQGTLYHNTTALVG